MIGKLGAIVIDRLTGSWFSHGNRGVINGSHWIMAKISCELATEPIAIKFHVRRPQAVMIAAIRTFTILYQKEISDCL